MLGQSWAIKAGVGTTCCKPCRFPRRIQLRKILTVSHSPYYRKSENFCEPDGEYSAKFHLIFDRQALGTNGPIPISYSKEYSPSHHLWHDTLENLNIQTNEAHLSGSNIGAWTSITSVDPKTMTRSYAAPAYYSPNAERPNLALLTHATVSELVLDEDGPQWTAKGVRFMHSGKEYTATASQEVIVCTGSVASPQLLELSGIGNPDVLAQAGIQVKVANPNVGENLQDHISEYAGTAF